MANKKRSAESAFGKSNERAGAERGSGAYQVMKKPATGTGRDAINAGPNAGHRQEKMQKQGSPGHPRMLFGLPARGLTKGYVK